MEDFESLMRPGVVTVYGVDTCDDTTRARRHLDAAGTPYRYVNMDLDPAVRAVVRRAGYLATPVVLAPAGGVLVEPSDEDLDGITRSEPGAARDGG